MTGTGTQSVSIPVHRSPSCVRDVRERPSGRDGMTIICHALHFWKREIFLIPGLDTFSANPKLFARREVLLILLDFYLRHCPIRNQLARILL